MQGSILSSSLASKQKTWTEQAYERTLGIDTFSREEDTWKSDGTESEDSPLAEHLEIVGGLLEGSTCEIDDDDGTSAFGDDTWKSDGKQPDNSSLVEQMETNRGLAGNVRYSIACR